MSSWREHYQAASGLWTSVNLSAAQFGRPELVAELRAVLEETGLPPSGLALEVTEDALLKNAVAAAAQAGALAELGIAVRLDRFGTATGALNLLRRFRLAGVKLDASLLAGIDVPGSPEALLFPAMAGLVRALGLPVTAVGVDHERHMQAAREAGCEEAQGTWFCEAKEPSAIEALLSQHAPHLGHAGTAERRTPGIEN